VDPIDASPERCDIDRWESFGKTSGCFRPGNKATDVVKNEEERETKELSSPPSSLLLLPTAGHCLHCGRWDCGGFAMILCRSVLSASCRHDPSPFSEICLASLTLSDLVPLPSPTVVVSVSGRCASSYVALFFFQFLCVLYSLSLSLSLCACLSPGCSSVGSLRLSCSLFSWCFLIPPFGSSKCVL
jgi:hypothetical protein